MILITVSWCHSSLDPRLLSLLFYKIMERAGALSLHPSQVTEVYKDWLNENLAGRGPAVSIFCKHDTKYSYILPMINSLFLRTNHVINSRRIYKPQEFANTKNTLFLLGDLPERTELPFHSQGVLTQRQSPSGPQRYCLQNQREARPPRRWSERWSRGQ